MFYRIFIAFSLEKFYINTVVRIAGVNYSYGNEVFLVENVQKSDVKKLINNFDIVLNSVRSV